MEEARIQFETAKLAAEKGFVLGSLKGYTGSGKLEKPYFGTLYKNTDLDNSILWEAPTQSLLQKWLREKYKIQIDVNFFDADLTTYRYIILSISNNKYCRSYGLYTYKTYEEALENALVDSLELIK